MILSDPSAERALLSILCKYGDSVYVDISDIVTDTSFTIDSNKYIYQCIRTICDYMSMTRPTSIIFAPQNNWGTASVCYVG